MIQAWQLRLLNNKPYINIEHSTAGTYNETLPVGDYRITLIGHGGGAIGAQSRAGTFNWAQGGVGGTLQVLVSLTKAANIQITVGGGGRAQTILYSGAGVELNGVAGTATSITGIPNVTLVAGGGTGAKFISTTSSAGIRTVGVMGTNSVSGVKQVLINNPTNIISDNGQLFTTAEIREPTGKANINYPNNTVIGRGGDCGWVTSSSSYGTIRQITGGAGYVLIETV